MRNSRERMPIRLDKGRRYTNGIDLYIDWKRKIRCFTSKNDGEVLGRIPLEDWILLSKRI